MRSFIITIIMNTRKLKSKFKYISETQQHKNTSSMCIDLTHMALIQHNMYSEYDLLFLNCKQQV